MNFKGLLTIATTILAAPQFLFAWADLGHQTVAEIAERNLSPRAQQMVYEIMGTGPLANLGSWPDLARSDARFGDFALYHFLEKDPRFESYETIPSRNRIEKDAHTMIDQVPKELSRHNLFGYKYNRNEKRIMLAYLVHIIGDVQQPFHVGNSYDRGANLCDIRYVDLEKKGAVSNASDPANLRASNLHSFWDDDVVKNIRTAYAKKYPNYKASGYFGYFELANLILNDPDIVALKDKYEEFAATPVYDWYRESQALHVKAYPDRAKYSHPTERPYCKHVVKDENGMNVKDEKGKDVIVPAKINVADVPTVSEEEVYEMARIAQLQILKGGLRLARVLNQMAEERSVITGAHLYKKMDFAAEKKSLERLQFKNKK